MRSTKPVELYSVDGGQLLEEGMPVPADIRERDRLFKIAPKPQSISAFQQPSFCRCSSAHFEVPLQNFYCPTFPLLLSGSNRYTDRIKPPLKDRPDSPSFIAPQACGLACINRYTGKYLLHHDP
ncbi:unnamed protein product [Protopolystoma xenopodis]|uniref:Uncharacterized protein n=1 Tax=Protopolystoma xenopodis TaxID=117903 RepID=A0A3S4ZQF3_9PLAT|nr:unnamed protein product [Protopolystoma xenopodis]